MIRHVKLLLESFESYTIFSPFSSCEHLLGLSDFGPPTWRLGDVQHVRRGTDGSWWPGSSRSFWISACRVTGMSLGRKIFFLLLLFFCLPAAGEKKQVGIIIEMGASFFWMGGWIKLQTWYKFYGNFGCEGAPEKVGWFAWGFWRILKRWRETDGIIGWAGESLDLTVFCWWPVWRMIYKWCFRSWKKDNMKQRWIL